MWVADGAQSLKQHTTGSADAIKVDTDAKAAAAAQRASCKPAAGFVWTQLTSLAAFHERRSVPRPAVAMTTTANSFVLPWAHVGCLFQFCANRLAMGCNGHVICAGLKTAHQTEVHLEQPQHPIGQIMRGPARLSQL